MKVHYKLYTRFVTKTIACCAQGGIAKENLETTVFMDEVTCLNCLKQMGWYDRYWHVKRNATKTT